VSDREARESSPEQIEDNLTFMGLLAMYDPPRTEAREAIRQCHQAGIRTVMITGDHPATAAAVATELGMLRAGDEVATGSDVQQLADQELQTRVDRIAVYARVTAEDKLRVVRAFKAQGAVVAMTGDGVNDAPAVQEAAIGVAMGITGTEVTKEASDMVITDDNFASIVAAVEEGRGIYENIKKCLQYLLAGNAAELLIMLAAVLIGWPLPLLPLHLLWINLVTDGLPALALATDPADADALRRPPRGTNEQLADGAFLRLLVFTGSLTAGVGLAAFYYGLKIEGNLVAARNYAFSALVYAELLRSFGARSLDRPFWSRKALPNYRLVAVVVASIAAQILIQHTPALQRLFGIQPISAGTCLALLVLGTVPLMVLELRKVIGRALTAAPVQVEIQT
jgi:P-type Ca2+ transporter type 2C